MACNFSIPFSGDPMRILNRAKTSVVAQGGTFEGDENTGNFHLTVFGNTIKGSYDTLPQQLNITITHKPFFLPCGTIEGFLRKQLD